jgi:hypothetical protein
MTNIDDSNTTPPGYWFGELNGRLRDRMRDELHDLDLGRRGWRILHALADGPATAEDLAATLPRHGRRAYGPDDDVHHRPRSSGHQSEHPEGESDHDTHASAAGRREWRGHPDWMLREWERRQEMYRAWMEHDREHPHPDPRDHREHDEHNDDHEHEHHEHEHEHDNHEHDEHHGEHWHHHQHDHHADGHGSQHAFERGFERGFVRGFERGAPFGAGRFAAGGFGPGRFGHGPHGRAHDSGYGHGYTPGFGRPPFAGRGRCRDHVRGSVDRVLADFVERGWVWFDGDAATLTDEGRAAHDAAFERIRAVRASLTEGIDPADLATTLATLEAMARNLGWTPEAETAEEEVPPTGASDGETRSDDPATD